MEWEDKLSDHDIAVWMNDHLVKHRRLNQNQAAHMILKRWGTAYVFRNRNGNFGINKSVLAAFKELNPADVVWSRSSQEWRFRMPYDPPTGRMVS